MKPALLLLFWAMWYLAFSTRTLLGPFLPMIQNEFVISHATTGGLLIFISFGQGLGYLYAGKIASHFGSKTVISISFLLATGTLIGISGSRSYFMLSIWLFCFGVCGGLYLPCAIPILTAAFSREHWGKAISIHETAAAVSILTIPYLTALLIAVMPWRSVFLVPAVIFAAIVPVFWMASPDTRSRLVADVRISKIIRRADLWIIMALYIVCAMGAIGVYSILPLFLVAERSMPIETANRLLSISRVGGFVGQLAIGFFVDRYDTGKIIILLMLVSGAALLGLGLADADRFLIAMLFLQATFCIVFFPVGIVAISKLTTPEERGVFAGIIMSVSTIVGCGLTPFLLGLVADIWRFQHGFIMLGLMNLAAVVLAVKLMPLLRKADRTAPLPKPLFPGTALDTEK
jgi:MFS transporter, NNP family, nitrate/nitrite transporter